MSEDYGNFTGASGTGLMETGPDADALSILQRVRDRLLALPGDDDSTEGSEAA
jgi:hypothetical protein